MELQQPSHDTASPDVVATLGGLTAAILVSSAQTHGSVALVEHTLAPGFLGAPPHTHQLEDETSYILHGTLTVQIGAQVSAVSKGGWIVKPRGILHTFWNSGSELVRFLEVISPGGFETYFAERARLLQPGQPPDPAAVDALQRKYHMTSQPERIPELLSRYGLRLT
jgi:quercetin dioxygenase-like cupin family protein